MSRFPLAIALAMGLVWDSCGTGAESAAERLWIAVSPDELASLQSGQLYVADLRDPNVAYVFDARAGAWQYQRVLLIHEEGATTLDAWLASLPSVDVEAAAVLEISKGYVIAAEAPPEPRRPPPRPRSTTPLALHDTLSRPS